MDAFLNVIFNGSLNHLVHREDKIESGRLLAQWQSMCLG